MIIDSSEKQVQKMLSIIYQIPMGLVEADADGNISAMNAKSVQLLMPLFHTHQLTGSNINQLLAIVAPSVLIAVQQFPQHNGNIVKQLRQEVYINRNTSFCFLFTVDKLDEHTFTYIVDDVTELYNKEKELNQMIQDNAIEQLNKFEIASGLLHDIGNAVVGFGSYITKIKRSIEQKNDIGTLGNLKSFFEKNKPALQAALGEQKSQAITDLLSGVIGNQENNLTDVRNSITDQMKIISHIQEILNIQRQYIKGHYVDRAAINVRNLINDSVSMLSNNFEKKGIAFSIKAPSATLQIKGDRTKLMQLFLNLLKNAADALATSDEEAGKEIAVNIALSKNNDKVRIMIRDNGHGFDAETGENLFKRGYTTKADGTGLGLVNCKNIVEGHNGQLTITSEGIGKGATSTVIFNL